MTHVALDGERVVVVGASAGIGRAFAVRAVKCGAEVVLGARRVSALHEAVGEAGGGSAIAVDVCDATSRDQFVAGAVEHLGSIDLLLSTVGSAELRPLAETDDETWARTMATNLVGLNRLFTLALPVLSPTGVLAVLSSEAATRPWNGLIPYAASKAALEATLEGLRLEHPGVRVSCVAIGPTVPTEFGDAFDATALGPAMQTWQRRGLLPREFMDTDEVAACLVDLYGSALRHPSVCVEKVVLRSPSPPLDR
jgi:NAD(P)-dependent dehydrogenase (short-subunit alcohol dehydrogenase family)